MDNKEKKSGGAKRILAVLAVLCAIYAWVVFSSTAPESGSLAFPSRDGFSLLAVSGNLLDVLPEDAQKKKSVLGSVIAKLHPPRAVWRLITPGKPPAALDSLTTAHAPRETFGPLWDGPDKIIIPQFPSTLVLVNSAGREAARKTFPRQSMRAISMSRDGAFIALSTIGDSLAPGKSPFRLYVFPSTLKGESREIEIAGIFPMLTAGSLQWDSAGSLYFSGFVREDHRYRSTYRVPPGSSSPVPVPGDWGIAFALSPDGAQAATLLSAGLKITNTSTGESRIMRIPDASPSLTLPAWSRDGKRLAFILVPRAGSTKNKSSSDASLVIADPSTFTISKRSAALPDFFCGLCPVAWSPSEKTVIVNGYTITSRRASLPTDKPQIRAIDIATGKTAIADDPAEVWK